MANNWKEVRFGDLCSIVRGGSPRPIHDFLREEGIPWIKISDATATNSRYIKKTKQFIREEGKAKTREVYPGDLIVSNSATPGIPRFLDIYACIHDGWLLLRDFSGLDKEYCFYLIENDRPKLIQQGNGSVFTNLKTDILKNHIVSLPDIAEQKAIAEFLGALDDKIELNRQINATLESMAQALFKSWFVDFEPVIDNALAAGNPIPEPLQARAEKRAALLAAASAADTRSASATDNAHPTQAAPHTQPGTTAPATPLQPLPADLRALFPDSFVFNEEMGWVPEGWEVFPLRTLTCKIGSGATPRGGQKVYTEAGVSLIRSQNVYDSMFVWNGLAHISDDAADQLKGVVVQPGDVLLNITGASILRTCIVDPSVLPARVNQHVAIIRPKDGVPSKYIHLHLLHEKTKNYLMGQNAGASREAVTKGHIEAVPTLKPSDEILMRFDHLTSPMCSSVDRRLSNIRTLSSIRDALLPRLLSGRVRLEEVDMQIEVDA